MVDFEDVITTAAFRRSPLRLVAIDGLPLAGKSTLADRLTSALGGECIRLDDFVKSEAEWRSHDQPSFPFDYIRYGEFMAAVQEFATTGACSFRPWDWATSGIAHEVREIRGDRPVVVEGVSALHPDLAPLYDLRIWVESDAASTRRHLTSEAWGDGRANGGNSSFRALSFTCSQSLPSARTSWREGAGRGRREDHAQPQSALGDALAADYSCASSALPAP